MFVFGNYIWQKRNRSKIFILQGEESFVIENSRKLKYKKGHPFSLIKSFVKNEEGEKTGFISYNLSRFVESFPVGYDDLNLPDAVFIALKREERENFEDFIRSENFFEQKNRKPEKVKLTGDIFEEGKNDFIEGVRYVRRKIFDGDVYQVNIARRISFELPYYSTDEIFSLFLRYFFAQKVNYPAFFDFSSELGFVIASGSPELFLEKKGDTIRSCPIKGTRRLFSISDVERVSAELVADEKERAENLMIVDMVRNDLGKICHPGKVKVKRLFDVEVYSTLVHLVSEVEGELMKECLEDILFATFPPASVTGAPKKSAMEIIEFVERKRRGPYCGAIAYFDESNNFTMSVAIRIFLLKDKKIFYWTGCGITYDSDPLREYEESLTKSVAFAKALGFEI
ncbi:Aminodeoxychorismate synthase component 1 [bacterium HR19]|nr:Aminodeoxychorismate synthase component 1 [bacterium HR19]